MERLWQLHLSGQGIGTFTMLQKQPITEWISKQARNISNGKNIEVYAGPLHWYMATIKHKCMDFTLGTSQTTSAIDKYTMENQCITVPSEKTKIISNYISSTLEMTWKYDNGIDRKKLENVNFLQTASKSVPGGILNSITLIFVSKSNIRKRK